MYPRFLDIGYEPSLFWDSTIQEIYDLMESYSRRQKAKAEEYEEKLKAEISLNTVLARQIGEYVGSLFSKKASITPLNKLFPKLFEDESEKETNLALYKAHMKDFAYRFNQSRKRKEE